MQRILYFQVWRMDGFTDPWVASCVLSKGNTFMQKASYSRPLTLWVFEVIPTFHMDHLSATSGVQLPLKSPPFFSWPYLASRTCYFLLGSGPPLEAPDTLFADLLLLLILFWEGTSPAHLVSQVRGLQHWSRP